jgi:hypothetical protein
MLRVFNSIVQSAIQYPQVSPAFFVSAEFAQGSGIQTLYAWNGVGNVTVGGITYGGLGSLMAISTIEGGVEGTNGISARNITVTVSGLDPQWANTIRKNFIQGGLLTISLALFSPNGTIITTPAQIFGGQMDTASVSGNGQNSTITLNIENRLIDLNRSRERLLTPSDIQLDHPLDQSCAFVFDVAQTPIYFGSAPAKTNNQI